ncbi:VanW family protein [Corynebacterium heidelbergense]|uniref:YoaR-like putative peptidoglycan binding domain-containing protein n=1 Tax=Corynebacterium heidelbergense TaxID=2055947 RepID=A0A364V6E3_9CORY|nr:VanW family protein [Corynebacterium heidelbergense]RAV32223.1 hypothetical protein DLJ54_04300 [Corynebacterium heidelbergense]
MLVALVGLAGILYGVDYVMSEGKVPRGTSVGKVDIGGLPLEQAEQRLRNQLGESTREPVVVNAGNMSSTVDPSPSGLRVDWQGTVEQAGRQPLNPITRIRSFFETREMGIVSQTNGILLDPVVSRVQGELQRQPKDAALSVDPAGKAHIDPDVTGQAVPIDRLRKEIEDNWLNTSHVVPVKADITEANLREVAAHDAAKKFIDPATSAPLVFKGRDNAQGVIRPEDMGKILTFVPDDKAQNKAFRPEWNSGAAKDILSAQLASTEREFRNASFQFAGAGFTVVPSQDGVIIKWDDTLGDLQAKALDTQKRMYDVVYEDKKADYTTEQAQKANFDTVVGEFTTGGFSDASGVNIRRVAEQVNGAVVLPGKTFSLNGYTGPRGAAQGYVESGIIQDGRPGKAIGGGISQFATTLYNASYFAGMDDVAHTPHSYYISRYPAGREATVFEGAIDLQFKNPFDTPVKIVSFADANSVTVRIYGVKNVNVESQSSPRSNPTSPPRQTVNGPECVPSSGIPGFTITDTRVVKDLGGREISRKSRTTVYDPQPIVTCSR